MSLPTVKIVEVGPRDGLQNEKVVVPTEVKARFIERLYACGLVNIEATSFVSPKWVPQLADADELAKLIEIRPSFSALVPNTRGLDRAVQAGFSQIALFTAASETFCQKNINMSRAKSLEIFKEVAGAFWEQRPDCAIRAYVSTVFQCPYEGKIEPGDVLKMVEALFNLGVGEVSLGDTIGVAGPTEVRNLTRLIDRNVGLENMAYHFHDTNGTALLNVGAALELGVTTFDSSAAGLGGCPYAPGAAGNLATEDLVYLLDREGLESTVDLNTLSAASLEVLALLGRPPVAKAQVAALAGAC